MYDVALMVDGRFATYERNVSLPIPPAPGLHVICHRADGESCQVKIMGVWYCERDGLFASVLSVGGDWPEHDNAAEEAAFFLAWGFKFDTSAPSR